MNRTTLAATTTAVLLLLTGCTATTQPEPVASGDTVSSAAPTASTAPLTAKTPAEAADTGEAAFLDEVRTKLRPDNVIPNATDEQLIEAGYLACEKLATRQGGEEISVIDGEQPDQGGYYRDSGQIVSAAAVTIC